MAIYFPNVPFIPPAPDYAAGPPANAASTLMMKMLAIQNQKREQERQRLQDERQAEIFRLAQEDRQRRIQQEDEDRALSTAKEEAALAAQQDREARVIEKLVGKLDLSPKPPAAPKPAPAATPMTPEEQAVHDATGTPAEPPPLTPMTPDELAVHQATGAQPPMDPDELAVHMATGSAIEPPPLTPMTADEQAVHDATGAEPPPPPLEDMDLGIGNANPQGMTEQLPIYMKQRERGPTPTIKIMRGGRELEIPLYDRTETRARAAEDAAFATKQKVSEAEALLGVKDEIDIPNDPEVFGSIAGKRLSRAIAAPFLKLAAEGGVEYRNVPDGYLKINHLQGGQEQFIRTNTSETAGGAAGAAAKGSWVTDLQDNNKRVWVTNEARATADPGRYSDVRPASTRINRTDPGRIKSALRTVGDGTETDSIWSLAVKINSRTKSPVEGLLKETAVKYGPEQFTSRNLPDENVYMTNVVSVAATIAKAFGDSGNLSDQDIKRAMMIFPKIGEGLPTTLRKLTRIRYMLASGDQDTFQTIFGREPTGADGAPAGGGGGGTPEAEAAVPPAPPPGFRIRTP